jgi:hypothetical protein
MALIQWKQISPFLSGSGNLTGSLNLSGSQSVSGDLTVGGILTAREYHSELISASVLFESGSSIFGNSFDDLHQFTGSVEITGSITINSQDLVTFIGSSSLFQRTGSYYATTNDVQITGSLSGSGAFSFENIPWPSPGEEFHLFKTDGYSIAFNNVSRSYEYHGVALEHIDDELDYKHNSLLLYTYNNHDNPDYGAELNIGPIRSHLRQYVSGSDSFANVSVQETEDGQSRALLYADQIQIGAYRGSIIDIGNDSASIVASGSLRLSLDGVEQYFSIDIAGVPQVKVTEKGVLQLTAKDTTPDAIQGGLFYSSSNEYFLGFV